MKTKFYEHKSLFTRYELLNADKELIKLKSVKTGNIRTINKEHLNQWFKEVKNG